MSVHRSYKMNKFIQRSFADLLKEELDLPLDIFCTIAKVETSPDFRYSKIFLSIYPENKTGSTLTLIKKKLPYLQKILFTRSTLRSVPQLQLFPDSTERKADKVECLLNNIRKERLSSYANDTEKNHLE